MHRTAAATYVNISREELEEWLAGLPHFNGKWKRVEGKTGIYLLPLSENVAVKLSSTLSSADEAMGVGEASTKVMMVSFLYPNMVLNRKAMTDNKSRLHRTTNWRKTWAEAIGWVVEAYKKSPSFYDNIARVEDRAKYQEMWTKKIEAVSNWKDNHILADFHKRLSERGILTPAQEALVDKFVAQHGGPALAPKQAPVAPAARPDPAVRERLLALWKKVVERVGRDHPDAKRVAEIGKTYTSTGAYSEADRAFLNELRTKLLSIHMRAAADLIGKRARRPATIKKGAQPGAMWVVHDPEPGMDLAAFCYRAASADLPVLAAQMGAATWDARRTALYTDETSARQDALARLATHTA